MSYGNIFYGFGERAFLRDKDGNEYTQEALYLALLLHCSGTARTAENEHEVGRLLNDPNQRNIDETRKIRRSPRKSHRT